MKTIKLSKAEAEKIVSLQQSNGFTDGWNLQTLLSSFNSGNFYATGIIVGGELIAYVSFTLSVDTADIETVLCDKECRKKGYAYELLKKAEEEIKSNNKEKIFLEVRENNIPAINLYKKFGFNQISVRKKYYEGKEDALIFVKEI